MQDKQMSLQTCKDMVKKFVEERDWGMFHTPKNLSMDISIEAAELMEKFLWTEDAALPKRLEEERSAIEDELADIFMAMLCFANVCGIDLASAFTKKLEATAKKYPVELVRGKSHKYTFYQDQVDKKGL